MKLLSDKECARMSDSELVNSMLILLMEGIVKETPNTIESAYKKYDKVFANCEIIELQFHSLMNVVMQVYQYLNGAPGCFGNKNYFFTLYCVIANQMFGIVNCDLPRADIFSSNSIEDNLPFLCSIIAQFVHDYDMNLDDKDNLYGLHAEYIEFAKHHNTRTTGRTERLQRISFLNSAIERAVANDHE